MDVNTVPQVVASNPTIAPSIIELRNPPTLSGKFRAECLNVHWLMSLDDAGRKCETWRRNYS